MAPSIQGPMLPSQPSQTVSSCKYSAQNSTNRPLEWDIVAKIAGQLRTLAVQQLVRNWNHHKSADDHDALWGDEIEYFLAELKDGSTAKPLLEQARVLKSLQSSDAALCFQPEFGKCCVESNPLSPYGSALEDLLEVEPNMRERRSLIKGALREGEKVLTLTQFPNFDLQGGPAERMISESAPAYLLSRKNLRSRRQRDWTVRVPLFRDDNTPWPSVDSSSKSSASNETSTHAGARNSTHPQDHVLIDDFNYGSIQCCMQVTLQSQNMQQARHLYDQFIPLSPIMLALTAATPIYKRQLVNTDARWSVLNGLFDDRNLEELARDQRPRSRWSSNSTYLAHRGQKSSASGATDLPVDTQVLESLLSAGMDEALATHFAHILRWDPVKLMTSDIEDAGENATNLFELFNNSCYQGVRFKPPPGCANPHNIGWRVEFRSMEVQLTDFENAAFSIFIYLVSRVIVEFNLKLYIPLSKVEENFNRAHAVNAVASQKFWFRTSEWCSSEDDTTPTGAQEASDSNDHPLHDLLSIDEIINGPQDLDTSFRFPGFIPLIKLYLARRNLAPQTESQLLRYLDLVGSRASGASPTAATWMRAFVRSHHDYHGDSVVPETAVYDLLNEIDGMAP